MKKYNTRLLLTFFAILICIITFNVIINPYDIFNVPVWNKINYSKPNASKQERLTKIIQLKFNDKKIDAILVGSSKTGWMTDEKYHSYISKKNIKSMTLKSSTLAESIQIAKNSITIHPEIKKVYIGVDFHSFAKNYSMLSKYTDVVKDKKVTKEELMPVIMSLDTFQYSISTFLANLKSKNNKTDKKQPDIFIYTQNNPNIESKFKRVLNGFITDFYKDYELNENNFVQLKEFIEFAKKKNIEVISFVPPMHFVELMAVKNLNNWEKYEKFKFELAQITPYYDFSILSNETTEKIRPDMKYFRDAVHATCNTGMFVAQRLYGINNNFGIKVDKSNIDYYVKFNRQKMADFIEKNPDFVQKVKDWSKD